MLITVYTGSELEYGQKGMDTITLIKINTWEFRQWQTFRNRATLSKDGTWDGMYSLHNISELPG